MRIELAENLKLVQPQDPSPTVEVDLESIPEDESFPGLLAEALNAAATPDARATAYCYFGPSLNFHTPTSAAFIVVANDMEMLKAVLAHFKTVAGVRSRFSDYVQPQQLQPQAHIEGGVLWKPLDVISWYADAGEIHIDEEDDPSQITSVSDDGVLLLDDDDDDDDEEGAAVFSRGVPSRHRAARSDASIGSIIRSIERVYGLPEGSVQLCGPNKQALRRDAKIGTLRRRWE